MAERYAARMPITFNDRILDRFSHAPLYRQLADHVRFAIDTDELTAGEALPSEGEIAKTVGISRTAVRDAMDVLVSEGLIVKRSGTATRVAEERPVRRMATSRYRDELRLLKSGKEHPLTSAFVTDHDVDWDAYAMDARYIEDRATDGDAHRLRIKPGAPVLRRHFVKYVNKKPVQLQESVIPWKLVKGTPVADPTQQPWPGGTIAELFSLGLLVTRIVEDAHARFPRDEERRDLDMEAIGPVWEVNRTFLAGDQPVETSDVIMTATHNVMHWETDLSDI